LSGSINILSEDGKNLRLVIAAIPWEKVTRLEQLEGSSYAVLLDADMTTYQFNIPVSSVSLYQHVLDTGESFFEADNSEYISQIIPTEFKFLVDAIVATFGGQPSICAPLVMEGKIQGLLTVNGVHLSEVDIPTVEAFANHTAVALENARLFAGMRAREAEQNRIESALRASEQKYREVIRQSTDGIILVNEEGLVIEWNAGMERITGIEQSEALDQFIWDIQLRIHPDQTLARRIRRKVISQTKAILKTGDSPMMGKPHEYEILNVDGHSRYIQLVVYSLKTEQGYRICSIVRDITEQRMLERDRLRQMEELSVLQSLSLDLTSVHELPVLLKSTVERAVQLLGAQGGGIYLCEPEREQVRL
jgi:PAS domain S-box-containing protein